MTVCTYCVVVGYRTRVYGAHSAGGQASYLGGRPLSAGTCYHVQESCQVSFSEISFSLILSV